MRVHTLETMHSMGKQPDAQQVEQLLNDKRNYQVAYSLFYKSLLVDIFRLRSTCINPHQHASTRINMGVNTLETMHSMGMQPDAQQVDQMLKDKKNDSGDVFTLL